MLKRVYMEISVLTCHVECVGIDDNISSCRLRSNIFWPTQRENFNQMVKNDQ